MARLHVYRSRLIFYNYIFSATVTEDRSEIEEWCADALSRYSCTENSFGLALYTYNDADLAMVRLRFG